jgi:hypothetical protein
MNDMNTDIEQSEEKLKSPGQTISNWFVKLLPWGCIAYFCFLLINGKLTSNTVFVGFLLSVFFLNKLLDMREKRIVEKAIRQRKLREQEMDDKIRL